MSVRSPVNFVHFNHRKAWMPPCWHVKLDDRAYAPWGRTCIHKHSVRPHTRTNLYVFRAHKGMRECICEYQIMINEIAVVGECTHCYFLWLFYMLHLLSTGNRINPQPCPWRRADTASRFELSGARTSTLANEGRNSHDDRRIQNTLREQVRVNTAIAYAVVSHSLTILNCATVWRSAFASNCKQSKAWRILKFKWKNCQKRRPTWTSRRATCSAKLTWWRSATRNSDCTHRRSARKKLPSWSTKANISLAFSKPYRPLQSLESPRILLSPRGHEETPIVFTRLSRVGIRSMTAYYKHPVGLITLQNSSICL